MPFLLPSKDRKRRLVSIQKHLTEHKEEGRIDALGKAVKLMLEEPAFQRHVASSPTLRATATGEASLMTLAWGFLYQHLHTRDFVAAAMVLWDSETFCAEAHFTQLIWEALMTKRMICIIGGTGCGKTYCPSAYFMLEFITDPAWTRFQVASASEDHLRKNLFADLIRLHSDASMALPGTPDTESIALDKKRGQGIFTLTLPGGPQSKSKIKGAHTKPRPMHPRFGRRSRVFCLIDECQETPQNIFSEITSRFSTVVGDDVEHLKFVLSANGKDVFSQFGQCAKPVKGWESIRRSDETWESEEGWTVLSLDATTHENVVQRKVIYPGFVTWDGVQNWLKKAHGNWEDPIMYSFVFGKFPPLGLASTIIKQQWLTAAEGDWIFETQTVAKAGADVAFTGDKPTLATGRVGRAIGWTDYQGERHMLPTPQWGIQVDAASEVQRHDDSQDAADEFMVRLKPTGIKPEGFGIDKTGGGRGVHDVIRRQWSQKVGILIAQDVVGAVAAIHGIEYASSPSEVKIAEEDTATPKELYDIMASELWFAAAKLFELGVVRIGKGVDVKVFAELAARQGGMMIGLGKKLTVESKKDFKRRTGMDSPDLADATLILISVARWTTPGLIPKAPDTALPPPSRPPDDWPGFSQVFAAAPLAGFGGEEIANLDRD